MTTNKNDKDTTEFATKDPIGEIKAHAQQLWEQAGSPSDRTWQSYRAQAEELLLAGRGQKQVENKTKYNQPQPPIDPYIEQLASQSDNLIVSILASAFKKSLNFHESFCLFVILSNNQLVLVDGSKIGPLVKQDIAKILGALASEYPEELIKNVSGGNFQEISKSKRDEYWQTILERKEFCEQVLSFHDLNTIKRLELEITTEQRVDSIHYVAANS